MAGISVERGAQHVIIFAEYYQDTHITEGWKYEHAAGMTDNKYTSNFNTLNTKRRLLYLKTQFVPHSKHFSSRL